MKNTVKFILIFLGFGIVSCSKNTETPSSLESQFSDPQQVSLNVTPVVVTKTSIDNNDMATTRWDTDDCIYIWSMIDGASEYTIDYQEFKLKYFSSTYDRAAFTATIDPMTEGDYTYFGVYPKPTSLSGTQVSYTLSVVQSGIYDGDLDILAANPTSGAALGDLPDDDFSLSFRHMIHAIRIYIPEYRNLFGEQIKTLKVSFPSNVVGTISFDASSTDSQAQLSNGYSDITLEFDNDVDEGDYIWMFIAPCELNGTITFQGFDSDGFMTKTISTEINKTMEAGRVTPITLTIPEAMPQTIIKLKTANNYLGENIETMTVTAPSGTLYADGASVAVLPYNSAGEYEVSYYAIEYGDAFRAGSLSIVYESANAIVSGGTISLSGVVDDQTNTISCDIPYLHYNDFSSISENGSVDVVSSLTDTEIPGLTDWVAGNRSRWYSGKCIAVRSYSNMFGPFDSRINSPNLSEFGLKSTANVTLKVTFNSDWCKNKSSSMKLVVGRAADSATTAGDAISSSTSISMTSKSVSESSTFTEREATISGCQSSYRIAWETDGENGTWFNYDPVYIDNLRIQIVN